MFDASTGIQERYEGDQQPFRLHTQGNSPLIVEYDDRNSLPIAYAMIGPVPSVIHKNPQLNLSLLHDYNQNLTGAQQLLLKWHCGFRDLNMPSVQRLFRAAAPFLSAKFAASSKCSFAAKFASTQKHTAVLDIMSHQPHQCGSRRGTQS